MTATTQRRRPIAALADIERIEAQPYEQAVPVQSTYALLQRSAALFGERPALIWYEGGDPVEAPALVGYRALLANVTRSANLFRGLGVGANDAVAILLPNMPEAHYALWGAQAAGRACPINPMLSAQAIGALAEAAGARVLVALEPPAIRAPGLRHTLSLEEFAARLAQQPDALAFERTLGRDDIAAYYHTGGTTGAPKLAQHTHGNEVHTGWFAGLYYDLGPDDVEINGFPLFHVAGAFVYGLSCFAAGAAQLLPTRQGMRHKEFVANYWRFVEKHRVTMLAAVPAVIATLLDLPTGGADISSVRALFTGGSPLPAELAAAFERAHGKPVRNILGMTECAGLVSIEPLLAPRVPGSCGWRLPYTEIRADALGAIRLRGPHVGPGYTDPARNAGTFEDGWLLSGDLGHIDAAGRIHITGRAKDTIIRGSHNIDPALIEEALAAHPAVQMCAAVGEPDPYAGELPAAFVTLRPGAQATPEQILAEVAPNIAERAAVPKRLTVLDTMPLTAIGKIYKPALRLRAIEQAFARALAGLPVTVRAIDEGGRIVALVAGDADDAELRERLGRFHVAWQRA